MASVLYELRDCIVVDTGEVIVKYKHFVIDRLLSRKPVSGLRVERQSYAERLAEAHFRHLADQPLCDIDRYNEHCAPERTILTGEITGEPEGPPQKSFEFNLPDEYKSLDLVEYLVARLAEKFPDLIPENYVERLMLELDMMAERQMHDFIRSLIYMIETWDNSGIVHGVGRGSACASLALYLIGVHLVDPIKYEIPISEFLR